MMKKAIFAFSVLMLFGQLIGHAQDFSTKGNDFWLCFPSFEPRTNITFKPAKMSLFVTSDKNSSGTITVGSFSTKFTVTANQTTADIDIPASAAYIAYTEAGAPVKNKGIHVKVDEGQPAITLYAYTYNGDARAASSLILPTHVLGKKYYSMNYVQTQLLRGSMGENNNASQFVIVAVEANTTVRYRLRRDGVLDNQSTTVTLQDAGDVLEIQDQTYNAATVTTPDLTGSLIESIGGTSQSCKSIAVFSGSSNTEIFRTPVAVRPGTFGPDPLFQQCYPVNTWGRQYGLVPFRTDTSLYHYRVLASEDNTTVTVDGSKVKLQAGEFYPSIYTQPVSKPMIVRADKPIAVAQYMLTYSVNGYGPPNGVPIGDPDMVLLNPLEQGIDDISVFAQKATSYNNVFTSYLNIVMDWQKSQSFRINGSAPKIGFVRFPAPDDRYGHLIENVSGYTTNSFHLTADTVFNAISYGVASAESYAYSAGTSVKDLTPSVFFQNVFKRVDSAITCVNSPVQFGIPLNYQPASLSWDFSKAPNISPNASMSQGAAYDSIGANGLYYYSPGKIFSFSKSNTASSRDTIKLYTSYATPNGCGNSNETYVFPVIVKDAISAKFSVANTGCISDAVRFTDQSNMGQGITRWLWNFGDGQTGDRADGNSFLQAYTVAGNYTAGLRTVTEFGCASAEVFQAISLSDKPVAKFSFPGVTCTETDIVFTDASTSNSGALGKWIWNLDDGTGAFTNTSKASPKTKYTAYGTKNPGLQVETVSGCKSDLFTAPLKINPMPEPGFILPKVCLNDAIALFTDTSKIAEGSIISYAWLFNAGSPPVAPGPATISSSVKDPQVKYNKADHYKVSLTVTSTLGCVATKLQDFTVNGSFPKANFTIANTPPYCGTKPVKLVNNSTVDFGSVTKLEIYWDFANAPAVKETDDNPAPGKIYAHVYPDLQLPSSQQYTIRMVAYSGGGSCSDMTSQTITAYPQPKASFIASATQLCYGDIVAFQDNSNGVSSAVASWVWDLGKGDRSAQKNPQKQYNDSGQINVSLYFYNAQGCISDTAYQQLTVYPNPQLLLTHKAKVLIGGVYTIKPLLAYGNQLQWLWTPATYLSSDTAAAPVSMPLNDITYQLKLTGTGGCFVTDTIFIKVIKAPEVPNAFSPNGDGINDKWAIKYLADYPGATLEVYNRYGQVVYRSVGYDVEWDGTYQGKPLPVGTYYYIINPKNGRQIITGAVTIIK